eukprot:scaffold135283_cov25-Tisochrysis_lutea.AAC.3
MARAHMRGHVGADAALTLLLLISAHSWDLESRMSEHGIWELHHSPGAPSCPSAQEAWRRAGADLEE